jgi:hypothetical protein
LQKRAERLERKQRRFLAGMLVLVAVFMLAGWRTVQPPQENFKTHGLSIVDSRGVVRLILGAPVPNPVEEGKTYERRSPGTGIIFNDAAGNERGGMGMLDPWQHESLLRRCQSRTQLPVFVPKLGNGVALNDARGETRAILYLDTNGAPHFLLKDEQGRSPETSPAASALAFILAREQTTVEYSLHSH